MSDSTYYYIADLPVGIFHKLGDALVCAAEYAIQMQKEQTVIIQTPIQCYRYCTIRAGDQA